MSRDIVRTDRAPIMPFHSQAVRAAGLVFVSAQAPIGDYRRLKSSSSACR